MDNNFYIYVYLDPRKHGQYCYKDICFLFEPFYIGKGKNNRYLVEYNRNKDFINITSEIKKIGVEPIIIKLYKNLSEEQSLKLETKLIKEIGRCDLKTGSLINKTSGGQGISGYKFSEKTKEIMSENRRKKFLIIKQEFENRKYKLLTEEKDYKTNKTKLKYICPNGHKGFICWTNFQQGQECPIEGNKLKSEKLKGKNSKLTEEQVIKIKLLLKEGKLTQKEIAIMFGVHQPVISNIKTGRTWSHININ